MASPFPPSSATPGDGCLVAQLLPHGISGLKQMSFQYPLKLISPTPSASQKSVLVFLLSYGGGLVGGDQINLQITTLPKSKLSIATQGHTKIFKSASADIVTRQLLTVSLKKGSALCLLPDPVQPFDGSVYQQTQVFKMEEDSTLCLLDWVCNGRNARGENWDCLSWTGRNEVWSTVDERKPRLLLRDNVLLNGDEKQTTLPLKHQMHGIGLFGTLILRGPLIKTLSDFFLEEFATLPRIGARDFRSAEDIEEDESTLLSSREKWRIMRLKQEKSEGIIWSVAKVRGCTVVKLGAPSVEAGRSWIGAMIREEGSLEGIFGEDALLCVK